MKHRSVAQAIRYVEKQPEPPGWPGDVEITTIRPGRIRTIKTAKDRNVYPLYTVNVSALTTTQPTVDRAHVIHLLRHGWSEPILISSAGEILDGHHRAYAASLLGLPTLARVVPVDDDR